MVILAEKDFEFRAGPRRVQGGGVKDIGLTVMPVGLERAGKGVVDASEGLRRTLAGNGTITPWPEEPAEDEGGFACELLGRCLEEVADDREEGEVLAVADEGEGVDGGVGPAGGNDVVERGSDVAGGVAKRVTTGGGQTVKLPDDADDGVAVAGFEKDPTEVREFFGVGAVECIEKDRQAPMWGERFEGLKSRDKVGHCA
jgi:hypothetical protein